VGIILVFAIKPVPDRVVCGAVTVHFDTALNPQHNGERIILNVC